MDLGASCLLLIKMAIFTYCIAWWHMMISWQLSTSSIAAMLLFIPLFHLHHFLPFRCYIYPPPSPISLIHFHNNGAKPSQSPRHWCCWYNYNLHYICFQSYSSFILVKSLYMLGLRDIVGFFFFFCWYLSVCFTSLNRILFTLRCRFR